MRRRDTLRLGLGSCVVGLGLSSRRAWADYQTCAGEMIPDDEIRCPDGSIPSHAYGDPPEPSTPAVPGDNRPKSGTARFTGIWHSKLEGTSYAHYYDVPGNTGVTGAISLRPGDLTLGVNGGFVWNILSAPFGRWIAAQDDRYDFLMILSGGKSLHGKVMPDGQLRILQDEQHIFFLTR